MSLRRRRSSLDPRLVRRRRASRRAPMIFVEGLESRRLLSITVGTFADVVDPGDGVVSLREAVALAAGTSGADVVVVPHEIGGVEGVYALTLGQLTIDDADPLTIQADGGSAVIDAQAAGRVFEVAAGSDVVFDGLTITGGYVPDPNTGSGAGIWNKGSIEITNCLLIGNEAGFVGGGLYNDLGTAAASNSVFENNTAMYGGGLSNNGGLTVTGGEFRYNDATQGSGGLDNIGVVSVSGTLFEGNVGVFFGGGFHTYGGFEGFSGAAEITDCTFRGNSSPSGSGGGAELNAAAVTITGTVFDGNTALVYGGGISMYQVEGTFDALTFVGNSAETGGGISTNSNLTLTNSSFQNNSAYVGGGLANASFVSIAGCSFVGNTGGYGGGISNGGTVVVADSTFEQNTATGGSGGGINNGGGSLTVTGGSFVGNSAVYGGGVYTSGVATITGGDFEGNMADAGGGLYSYYGSTSVAGSRFAVNSAVYSGGGVMALGGTIQASDCDVEGNSAAYDGGGVLAVELYDGFIETSRIQGNSASNGGGIYLGYVYSPIKISGNDVIENVGGGIAVQGYYTQVLGNTIAGNIGDGVRIGWGGYNAIGTPDERNTITGNTGAGVVVWGYSENPIRGNVIHSNGGLAIDLGGDGRTENDPGDYDWGPNNYQNFPIIESFSTGAATRVVGRLNSQPYSIYTIDVYADATGSPVNPGEGSRYLGSFEVVADANGDASFDVTLDAATAPGEIVTATATDAYGNTSEFSSFLPIRVTPASGLSTSESGSQAVFSVVLTMQPTADVVIPLSSTDLTEGVVSPSALTFTPANWNVPQVVTVTGVDDAEVDGPVAYAIAMGPVTSPDPIYDGLGLHDVPLVNFDDDFAAMQSVAPAGSLIYRTDVLGAVGSSGNVERYSITLDPGQSFSVLVESDPGLRADVSVSGPSGTTQKSASAAGSAVLIQGIWTPNALTSSTAPTTYTITVKGRSGTTGGFRLAVVLNASLETEAHGGAANNSLTTAQNIDRSFVGLQGVRKPYEDSQPGRRAVLGSTFWDDVDYYRVDLKRGQSATILLTNAGSADVALIGPGGAVAAQGVPSSNGSTEVIADFFVTVDGTYYLQVSGYSDAYALVVTQNATLDVEPNDSIETARDLIGPEVGGRRWVMGAVSPSKDYFASAQSYTFEDISGTGQAVLQGSDDGAIWLYSEDLSGFQFTSFGWSIQSILVSANGLVGLAPASAGWTTVLAQARDLTVFGSDAAVYWQVLGAGDDQRLVVQWNNVGFFGYPDADPITFEMVLREADGSIQFNYKDLETSIPDFNEGLYATVGLYGWPENSYSELYLDTSNAPNAFVGTGRSTRIAPVASKDLYRISASGGATLEIETALPAAKSGEFANRLDPIVRLYDAAGNLVATNDDGASDGRNARLIYKVPQGAGGDYYIEVAGASSTLGEYVLSVKKANVELAPFIVSAMDIPDGARVRGPVSQFTIDFNDAVLLTTLQASDVKIDGIAATEYFLIDGDTVVFAVGRELSDGVHQVSIAAGALTDVQGTPVGAFASSFYNDVLAPRIVSSSLQEGDVVGEGDLTVTIVFSEAMDRNGLEIYDVNLWSPRTYTYFLPTSVAYDDSGTVLTINFTGLPEDAYTLILFSTYWAFQDAQGWLLDGEALNWPIPPNPSGDGYEGGDFVVNFVVDAGARALPTPEPVDPEGGLISQTPFDSLGLLAPANDVDDWTIDLTAGSTATVLVASTGTAEFPAFAPIIELLDPEGGLVAVATADEGQTAFLQTVPVGASGTYTIRVAAAGDGTGFYTVRVIVNAAIEEESVGGAPNNEIGTAQNIESSFIDVSPSETRGAVIGRSGDDDYFAFHLDAGDSVDLGLAALGEPPPLFGPASYVDAGFYYGFGEAAADVNGDSHVDLVVTSYGFNLVSVLLGNGDGTFAAPTIYNTGSAPQAVALGDVTGDGLIDTVVAHNYDGVWVFPGDGGGAFGAASQLGGLGDVRAVALADLNGDDLLDIVTANGGSNSVSAFLNNGDGSFTRSEYAAGNTPVSIVVADVDGDTIPDLVVGNYYDDETYTNGAMSILLGDGSGGFGEPTTYLVQGAFVHVATADFDGDGRTDVAASSYSGFAVSLFLNNGDGTFGAPAVYGVYDYPISVAAADVNGDGKPDVVTAGDYGTIAVLLGQGDGAFGSPSYYQAGYSIYSGQGLVLADFNGDGLLDLSATNFYDSHVVVLLNQTFLPTLELLDADGAVLASGVVGSEGLELAIAGFTAPADGVYYVRVGGPGVRDYSLVVTRSAETGDKAVPEQSALQASVETAGAIPGLGLAAEAVAEVELAATAVSTTVGANRVKEMETDDLDRAIESLVAATPWRPTARPAVKPPTVRLPAVASLLAAPRPVPWKRSKAVQSKESGAMI